MSIREDNKAAIVEFFESGIKADEQPGRIGVELEHTIVAEHSQAVSYGQPFGVKWILEQLADEFPEKTYSEKGDLLGVAKPGQAITLEPAAQLELSAGPYEEIGEIRLDFETFQRDLAKMLAPHGLRALAVGYHPTAVAGDLALIPKQRYEIMDRHFATIGPWGRRMMRGSASTQISIDYYSEKDCLRKMRLASALGPIFALMSDNAPSFEGKPSPHGLMRTEIWRGCDPARCGLVPGVMQPDFSLERYAEYVLDTPALMTIDEDGRAHATDKTFGELHADAPMTQADVEHALSLFFNDVRLKSYIEIRPADAMPIPFATAYAALVKGLFYFEENLDALDELFGGVDEAAVEQAKTDLMEKGYDAVVYGRPVGELADELMEKALGSLAKNERNYLNPLNQIVKVRKTLSDMGRRAH